MVPGKGDLGVSDVDADAPHSNKSAWLLPLDVEVELLGIILTRSVAAPSIELRGLFILPCTAIDGPKPLDDPSSLCRCDKATSFIACVMPLPVRQCSLSLPP